MKRTSLAASLVLAAAVSASTALVPAEATIHHDARAEKPGVFTVTATVNKAEPEVGDTVKIKGTVRPVRPGAKVVLQVKYAGQKSWKRRAVTALTQAGKFKFKLDVRKVRDRKYRVVKPAGGHRAAGHSKALKVTVFGWRMLDSLAPVQSVGFTEAGKVSIDATPFPHSLRSADSGTGLRIGYNLNRRCKAIETRIGLSDDSAASGSAAVAMVADVATRASGSYALTESDAVAEDLTGVFRLTFTAEPEDGGMAAVGSPRVLCSF